MLEEQLGCLFRVTGGELVALGNRNQESLDSVGLVTAVAETLAYVLPHKSSRQGTAAMLGLLVEVRESPESCWGCQQHWRITIGHVEV